VAQGLFSEHITNTMEFPSGIQNPAPTSVLGSSTLGITCFRLPPSAGTTNILRGLSVNRICFPSGDQRGSWAFTGGNVNCSRSLPSNLLRQRLDAGNVVYTTHWPSRETSNSPAEIPPRNGTNCFDLRSYLTSSIRRSSPITNKCFPSALGVAAPNFIGPVVNCAGTPNSALPQKVRRSGSTQISRLVW